jgi:hypothetical protein
LLNVSKGETGCKRRSNWPQENLIHCSCSFSAYNVKAQGMDAQATISFL